MAATMLGWCSWATARISVKNRARRRGSWSGDRGSTLMATRRRKVRCSRLEDHAHAAGPQAVENAVIAQDQAEGGAGPNAGGLVLGQQVVLHQQAQDLPFLLALGNLLLDLDRQRFPVLGQEERRGKQPLENPLIGGGVLPIGRTLGNIGTKQGAWALIPFGTPHPRERGPAPSAGLCYFSDLFLGKALLQKGATTIPRSRRGL